MKLRTYQAYTMAEALAAVKRDLGARAVILNTRTFQRGGVLGIGRKTIVEVTATPPTNSPRTPVTQGASSPPGTTAVRDRAKHPPGTNPTSVAALRAYGGAKAALTEHVDDVGESDRERTRKLAIAMAEKFARAKASTNDAQPAPVLTSTDRKPAPPVQVEPAARRFVLTPQIEGQDKSTSQQINKSTDGRSVNSGRPQHAAPSTQHSVIGMQDELAAIRSMVGQVLQQQKRVPGAASTMPAPLFDLYLKLIAQDMSEELADRIVGEVRNELSAEQIENEATVRAAVLRRLSECLPVANDATASESPDGRSLTIALVGPTGVGKTTTIAKLAASFKLRQGRRVGLITSDTYRIAAVDQLRTYANIIGLPLQVALTPAEMRQAVHSLRECDVILIDTAGRGQNDSGRLAELREFIVAADPHEVHLVLSGTAGEKVLLREAEAFSVVGVHKIVLTKLDEAVSFGMLIDVVRQVGKQLSFITTGQEVPDHIESGRPQRLAELALGGEVNG